MSFLTLNPNQSTYTPGGSLEGQVFQPTYEPAPTLQLSYVPSPSHAPQATYVPAPSYSAPAQLAGGAFSGQAGSPSPFLITPGYDTSPGMYRPNFKNSPGLDLPTGIFRRDWLSPTLQQIPGGVTLEEATFTTRAQPSAYDTGAFADIGKPGTTESAATAYRLEPGRVVSPVPGEVKPTAPVAVAGAGGAFPSNALPGSPVAGQPPAASAQAGPIAVVETGGSWGGYLTGRTLDDGTPETWGADRVVQELDVAGYSEKQFGRSTDNSPALVELGKQKAALELKLTTPGAFEPGENAATVAQGIAALDASIKSASLEQQNARAYVAGMEGFLRQNPAVASKLLSGKSDPNPVEVGKAAVADMSERYAPLLSLGGSAAAGVQDAASAVESAFAVAADGSPKTLALATEEHKASVKAVEASFKEYLARTMRVPENPSSPSGYTQRDVERIQAGLSFMDEKGISAALPGARTELAARLENANDDVAVANGTASEATALALSADATIAEKVKGWEMAAAGEAAVKRQLPPARAIFKTRIDGINEAGLVGKAKADAIAAAAVEYNNAIDAAIDMVGRTQVKSNNPFKDRTYAGSEWNWEGIMAGAGLALALYAPFERRESERRAERRADRQWEKEKEWWKERAEIEQGYRMEALNAQLESAEATSGKGRPSGVQVAQF